MAETEMTEAPTLAGSKLDFKAIGAVALGNMLEFYDFITFSFFALDIGRAFFPSKDPTTSLLSSLAVFWSGFIMRPLGGVLIGALADRLGRKPAMVLTIALMALGMLMLAATPSVGWFEATFPDFHDAALVAPVLVISGRLIQGFALGGEVGPSTAYLLEAAPQRHRAFFASWQTASQGGAAIVAGVISLTLTFTLDKGSLDSWGWRVPFFLGIAIVPVGVLIRSHLPETAGEGEDPEAARSTWDVLRLLIEEHGRRLLLTLLVIMAATISFYIGTYMTTFAKDVLKLSKAAADGVTILLGVASLIFTLIGGYLADRYGRRPVMVIPRIGIVLVAIPVFWLAVSYPGAASIFFAVIVLSALSSISTAAIIVAVPEALPRNVRSAGLSIVYALAVSLFGGSAPWLVTKLIATTHDKLMPAYYVAATSLIGAIAAYLLPETRGRSLD